MLTMLCLAIILIAVGVLMLVSPSTVWTMTERWKTDAVQEASDLYIKSIRFGGVLVLLAGLGGVIAAFLA